MRSEKTSKRITVATLKSEYQTLQQYAGELLRYAQVLQKWDADLQAKEDFLEQELGDEEEGCKCGFEDCFKGCDCDWCLHLAAGMEDGSIVPPPEVMEQMKKTPGAARLILKNLLAKELALGAPSPNDEVKWLETLHQLPDRRRKRKSPLQ